MGSFWQDLCCCFGSPCRRNFDGTSSFSNNFKMTESESNIYGNTFSHTYGNSTTVNSLNSVSGSPNNGNATTTGISSIMGFYRSKPKNPKDLVKNLKYNLNRYDTTVSLSSGSNIDNGKVLQKLSLEISKPISCLKGMVLQSEEDVSRGEYDLQMFLIKEVYESDLFEILCSEIEKFPFEARKDAVIIFNSLLRRQIPPNRQIVAEHLRDHKNSIFKVLLSSYDRPERTLHYGLMLRECIKFEFLAEIILNLDEFGKLFDYIQLPTFDVSSDAFATFKDLLTRHKNLVAIYLLNNYDETFKQLNALLISENYVTRRQSLKLLGEILHDRRNYEVMLKYVSEVENLKLLMVQLRDKSEKIQFEAFQVFKIFIANPNKPKPIYDILCKNRDKILHFLENFNVQGKQMDDRNFNEDKLFLIEKLQLLPQYQKPIPSTSSLNSTLASSASNPLDLQSQESVIQESDKIILIPDDATVETESLVLSRSSSVLSSTPSILSGED